MHAKHTLFAFNILLPAAAPLPDGTYDAVQQIWVGATATVVAWTKKNARCGQYFGSTYRGGGYVRCWLTVGSGSCQTRTDIAKTRGCLVKKDCQPEGDWLCSEICCPSGVTP
jgi:hypothetical protein